MKKFLKIAVPLAILSFLIWTVAHNWPTMADKIASANLTLLLVSIFILSLTYLGGAYFWYKVLQAISFKTSFKQVFRVFIISNFGRFIPGVVLHYVARVYFAKGLGLGVKEGTSSVVLEAYYNLAGAILVSALALPLLANFSSSLGLFFIMAITFLIIFLIQPVKFFSLFFRFPYFGKHLPKIVFFHSFKQHLFLLTLSVVLFLLYGVGFFLLSSAFVENPLSRVLEFSGLLAASWVVGFLAPVAPGGLGVSDFSLAYLLQPFYDFSLASFLAVAFRFNLFLAEGLMFLLVLKIFGLNGVSSFKEKK